MCVGSHVGQSCPTVCDPVDYGPPGSYVHGIFQAKILEWVVISFSGDLPNPGIKPWSPALQADSLPSESPCFLLTYLQRSAEIISERPDE